MLATHCTFCQHENSAGARFCAECGSPLHLKVCANPQCGKVSEVSATVCETCGQPFPPIDLVAAGTADAPAGSDVAAAPPTPPPAPTTADKPRTALWPLIAVAVAAGALPLLWANRAYIPAPKSGPFGNPEIAQPASPPTAVPPAPAAVAPPPVADPPAATPTTLPATPPATASASELDPASPAPATKTADKSASTPERPATKKPAAPRACTEALAALGLCPAKQAGK